MISMNTRKYSTIAVIVLGVMLFAGTAVAKVLTSEVRTPYMAIAYCGGGAGEFVTQTFDDGTTNIYVQCWY